VHWGDVLVARHAYEGVQWILPYGGLDEAEILQPKTGIFDGMARLGLLGQMKLNRSRSELFFFSR
jgi:hypothetical protein